MLAVMDIQTIWVIVLSVSTPIAGVVGFGLQLRQVKKARLENEKLALELLKLSGDRDKLALELEKLSLEIEALRNQSDRANSRILVATTVETKHFNDSRFRFSRVGQGDDDEDRQSGALWPSQSKPSYVPWFVAIAGVSLLAFLAWAYWPR